MKIFKRIILAAVLAAMPSVSMAQQAWIDTISVKQNSVVRGDSVFGPRIEFERSLPAATYPNAYLELCADVNCKVSDSTMTFAIDQLDFEIFKFSNGSNPYDPASTPPIRTISIYAVGDCVCPTASSNCTSTPAEKCATWDGSYNLNGLFGKTNGEYGFRATVKTNYVSNTAGNISIQQTSAFPGQNQKPIVVDVTNIHVYRATPTVVGKITGVAAQPYNILYRLSKGATVSINLYDTSDTNFAVPFRNIVSNLPRIGEGIPDGTLTNGDFWDGRDNQGRIVPKGTYIGRIEAQSTDQYGTDDAYPATFYMELDPLQITDVAIKPLGQSATDVAMVSFMLTEAATVYLDIYPPGTSFGNINCSTSSDGCTPSMGRLKRLVEQKTSRVTTNMYWDGRDENGNVMCDGDYVFALSAVLPGAGGNVWTSRLSVGTLPISRGMPLAFLSPSSTVIGSTPSAAGLDPFYFRYTLYRPGNVTLNIRDMSDNLVRTVIQANRSSGITNVETWDGKRSNGNWVSSGTYKAEIIVNDPYSCPAVQSSSHTVTFLADMFRVVDVKTIPLTGDATGNAGIQFELSQSMWVDINIYNQDAIIRESDWPWQTGMPTPVYSVSGVRPGRYKITEYWDGRDDSGYMVADGRYPFTLVAHSTGAVPYMYATDKVYGYVDVSRGNIIFAAFDVIPNIPQTYNSSDTIKLPPYEIDYVITRQSSVTIQILTLDTNPQVRANVISGQIRDADVLNKDFWDGKRDDGSYITPGPYNVRIVARDISTKMVAVTTVQMTIDVFPLRIFDVSIAPLTLENPAVISYQISEPMKVVTKVYKPGTTFDSYGNAIPPESSSLVKRIIGVRPARTQINEYWDGTDLAMNKVPDGNYVFKIYASTDTNAIDSITGNYGAGVTLADDVITSNIPVLKTAIGNLCDEFEKQTFFKPNPYTGNSGKFVIYVPSLGNISLKIYNLAGDRVYSKDFTGLAGDSYINCTGVCGPEDGFLWDKKNSAGRTVAPGVYIAVLRYEATGGAKDICQIRKKILIP